MSDGIERLKVIFCGALGAGKTTAVAVLSGYDLPRQPTRLCIEFDQITIQAGDVPRDVRLQLWDTHGIERFRSHMPRAYFRIANVALLCFSLRDRGATLRELPGFIEQVREHGPVHCTLLLVACMSDAVASNPGDTSPPVGCIPAGYGGFGSLTGFLESAGAPFGPDALCGEALEVLEEACAMAFEHELEAHVFVTSSRDRGSLVAAARHAATEALRRDVSDTPGTCTARRRPGATRLPPAVGRFEQPQPPSSWGCFQ